MSEPEYTETPRGRRTWTIYETETGRIVSRFGGTQEQLAANIPEGCEALEGEYDPRAYWVVDGAAVARISSGITLDTSTIVADGVDAATLSNVPTGAEFYLGSGQYVTVTDGTLEIVAELVGEYRVELVSPEYIPEVWRISAT